MKNVNRYTCGSGNGMFEDKKGDWIEYEEYLKILNKLKEQLRIGGVGNSKRETLGNFSELLQKVVKKTKASDTGLIYVDAGDIMQDVCDNYIIIKK